MLNYLIFFPLISAFVVLLLNRGGIKVFSVVVSFMILALNLDIFADFLQGVSFDYNLSFKILKFQLSCRSRQYRTYIDAFKFFDDIFKLFIFKAGTKALVSCIFFLEFAIMGLFSAKDGLLFYVFWEFSLLPLLYIMGVYGKDFRAGVKFLSMLLRVQF